MSAYKHEDASCPVQEDTCMQLLDWPALCGRYDSVTDRG